MTGREYIARFSEVAMDSVRGTALFPSLTMAQAMLESGYGESVLAKFHNNHFGIKAGASWTAGKVNLQTREVYQGNSIKIGDFFRVYPTVLASYKDRNSLLQYNSRYHNAGVFSSASPEEQAIALQRAGYATDPYYANILINLIYKYNLKELDSLAKKKVSTVLASLPLCWVLPLQESCTYNTIQI